MLVGSKTLKCYYQLLLLSDNDDLQNFDCFAIIIHFEVKTIIFEKSNPIGCSG